MKKQLPKLEHCMNEELNPYFPIAQAIALLLHPWAEVVTHDLETLTIAGIYNNFSKRKIGEDSLLEEELNQVELPPIFEPYYKTNWDGRHLKSTTATLKNFKGKAIGLLCINLDVSKLEEMQHLISQFISQAHSLLPNKIFSEDWREKISVYVKQYLMKHHLTLSALSKQQKMNLVHLLHQEGAFKAKHAAHYIADILKISRATVYKYLSELSFETKK